MLKNTAIKDISADEPQTANQETNFQKNILSRNLLNTKRNGNQRDALKQLVQRLR